MRNPSGNDRGISIYNLWGGYQYTLQDGWNRVTTNQDLIRDSAWNYVAVEVLGGAMDGGVPFDTIRKYMRLWDALIDSVGAKTVIYLPWYTQGFYNDWEVAEQHGKNTGLDTILTFLHSLCTQLNAVLLPGAVADYEVYKQDKSVRLWSDGLHGSPQTDYLVSLVSFAALTGQDPRGISNFDSCDAQTCRLLQQMAWQTVFNSVQYPFNGIWTRPPLADRLQLQLSNGIDTLEKYLTSAITGNLHFTDNSMSAGTDKLLFRSLTPSIVTVDHFGRAMAASPGTARIEGQAGDARDTITFTVTPSTAKLDSIRIFPRVFTGYVTDQFHFTATGYAFHMGQHVEIDLTTQCTWISGNAGVFTLINGMVMKKTAQGGPMFVAVSKDGLTDTVRFTMLQDLSLLLRINFQDNDTIYNPFWKADWGKPYTDSAGFGWVNTQALFPYSLVTTHVSQAIIFGP